MLVAGKCKLCLMTAVYCMRKSRFYIFTDPSARAEYDTWSIFKRSLTGLIQSFSSPRLVVSSKLKNLVSRGVMVIVAGIGHGDTSSNPGLIAFHIALIPLGKV